MDKLRIVIVFHSENIQSGATRSLIDIVNYLIETERYDIQAIFPKKEGTAISYLQSKGIKTHYYKYGGLMQNMWHPLWKKIVKFPVLCYRLFNIKKEAKHAAKHFKKEKIDLVYSNTSSIVFGGYLGKYLNCKQAWHIREFRKFDHHISFFLGDKQLQKFINKYADVVFFVSKSVRDIHTKYIDPDKMHVTYNSYPQNFIRPREAFNKTNELNVLIAGDIKPSKGQLDCIEAITKLRKSHPDYSVVLHLAGRKSDDSYYKKVVDLSQSELVKGKVILHGQVSDMISLRDEMDVGIVASCNEAFGRTTIEGMLSMMAMIGRNSGGTTEQICDGKNGLLYDGSVDDLASKLLFLYENRDKMEAFAKAGFEECVNQHTKGRCAKIVDEALESLMRNVSREKKNE